MTGIPRRGTRLTFFLLLTMLSLALPAVTGCSGAAADRAGEKGPGAGSLDGGGITVFAASSLSEAFSDMADAYQSRHPGVEVVLNFDGSQRLRTQLEHGARADVFASADWDQMEAVEAAGLTSSPPASFASNRLIFLVYSGTGGARGESPENSPAAAVDPLRQRLEYLAEPGRKVVLGQPEVPIGRYTEAMLARMEDDPKFGRGLVDGVRANLVSREPNVRAIVQKVVLGEADAGVAYRSDALLHYDSQETGAWDLPDSVNVTAHYPIAALTGGGESARFIEFVLSEEGQRILRDHGFGPPSDAGSGNH